MNTISQRLIYLLDTKNITIYGLSQRTGISQASLGEIKNKGSKPNNKNRAKLAAFFGVTVEWLIYGEEKNEVAANNLFGDEFKMMEQNGVKHLELPMGKKVAMIPYVDENRVDSFANNPDNIGSLPFYPYHTVDFILKKLIAFRMNDDSMENGVEGIKKGAVLVANEVDEKKWNMEALYNGSQFFVIICKGLLMVRCVKFIEGNDYITLQAKNKRYSDVKLPLVKIGNVYRIEQIQFSL